MQLSPIEVEHILLLPSYRYDKMVGWFRVPFYVRKKDGQDSQGFDMNEWIQLHINSCFYAEIESDFGIVKTRKIY